MSEERAREGVMGEVTFELVLECLRSLPVLIWRDWNGRGEAVMDEIV